MGETILHMAFLYNTGQHRRLAEKLIRKYEADEVEKELET